IRSLLIMKILIVEDQKDLSDSIIQYLHREGIFAQQALNCEQALEALSGSSFDVVLLDIMLPDGNGLDVLKAVKHEYPQSGVIIISAKDALDDKLHGLDLGADDYLTKPFHLSELNARAKAVYRRRNFDGKDKIEFNEISVRPDTMEVLVNDDQLVLTRKEYDLLLYFMANKNRVLTKQAIAEYLWGNQLDLYDSFDFVYQHIKNLRKKITEAGGADYITTIYGLGYKFNTRKA
ncbi:MAG: response regulator transcription factor, partial [Bacteroidota bacterium]